MSMRYHIGEIYTYSRIDFSTPAMKVLPWVHSIRIENTGQLDLELDGAILV